MKLEPVLLLIMSLSGAESAGILQLLMSLDRPGSEVVRAVKAGAEWFKSAQLARIRQVIVNGDKRIVQDTNASPSSRISASEEKISCIASVSRVS